MSNAFESFWRVWPSSPRKASKSKCLEKWEKLRLDFQATDIIKHVAYMKTTDMWLKSNGQFIPAPIVYLNQMRWDGAEIPEIKPTENVVARIDSERAQAAPMPKEVRQKLAELRKQLQTPKNHV